MLGKKQRLCCLGNKQAKISMNMGTPQLHRARYQPFISLKVCVASQINLRARKKLSNLSSRRWPLFRRLLPALDRSASGFGRSVPEQNEKQLLTRSYKWSRGAVAQSIEYPSKVAVWCISTDTGSNPGAAVSGGRKKNCREKILIRVKLILIRKLVRIFSSFVQKSSQMSW